MAQVGTPYYVAPEVVQNVPYDWKSDIWSLGCLLYELSALRSPFEMAEANLMEVFSRITRGEFAPLSPLQWSGPLRRLLAAMLDVRPDCRPSAADADDAAAAALAEAPAGVGDVFSLAERTTDRLAVRRRRPRI